MLSYAQSLFIYDYAGKVILEVMECIYIYRNKICPTYRPDIGIAALYGGGERGGEKEVGLDGLRKKGEGEEDGGKGRPG